MILTEKLRETAGCCQPWAPSPFSKTSPSLRLWELLVVVVAKVLVGVTGRCVAFALQRDVERWMAGRGWIGRDMAVG